MPAMQPGGHSAGRPRKPKHAVIHARLDVIQLVGHRLQRALITEKDQTDNIIWPDGPATHSECLLLALAPLAL